MLARNYPDKQIYCNIFLSMHSINLKNAVHHEELIELLAIPLSDQRTFAKWLVNEGREGKTVDCSNNSRHPAAY